mmetsp:Transcript_7871/g.12490  ORF Transcript_7871/g.12490 Transcript_7871/m.12490 type:complete len:107 (+) Transcript_7871:1096-1416(+)
MPAQIPRKASSDNLSVCGVRKDEAIDSSVDEVVFNFSVITLVAVMSNLSSKRHEVVTPYDPALRDATDNGKNTRKLATAARRSELFQYDTHFSFVYIKKGAEHVKQ